MTTIRNNIILWFIVVVHLQLCLGSPVFVPQFLSGGTGRNIRHLPCVSRRTGEQGVCMFAFTCAKANGTHLGTCIDRFYFGSCCKIDDPSTAIDPFLQDNTIDTDTTSPAKPFVSTSWSSSSSSSSSSISSSSSSSSSSISSSSSSISSTIKPLESNAIPGNVDNKLKTTVQPTKRPLEATTQSTRLSTFQTVQNASEQRYTTLPSTTKIVATKPTISSTAFYLTSTSSTVATVSKKPTPPPTTFGQRITTKKPVISSTAFTKKPVSTTTVATSNYPVTRFPPRNATTISSTKKPVKTTSKRPTTTTTTTTTITTTTSKRPTTTTSKKPTTTTSKRPTTTASKRPTTTTSKRPTTTASKRPTTTASKRPATTTTSATTTTTTSRPITTPPTTTRRSTQATTLKRTTTTPSPQTYPATTTVKHPSTITFTAHGTTTTTTTTTTRTTTMNKPASKLPIATTVKPSVSVTKATAKPTTTKPTFNVTISNEIDAEFDEHTPGFVTWSSFPDESSTKSPTKEPDSTETEWPSITTPDGWIIVQSSTTEQEEATELEGKPVSSSSSSTSSTATLTIATSKPITTTTPTTSTTSRIESPTTTTTTTTTQRVTTQPTTYVDMLSTLASVTLAPDNIELPTAPLNMSNYKDVCGRRLFPESRIVGGDNSKFGKWPWQISLRQWRTSTYLHKCGAALLNENWAITAAHCVQNVLPSDLLLRIGEHDLGNEDEPYGFQERRVQIVASHPNFDPRTFEFDLALMRFYEPVLPFQPNVLPICIPDDDEDYVGQTAFVTGWGRLYEDGPLPSVLQEVAVPVINNSICEGMYRNAGYIEHIPHIFICAGWRKGGFDSCEGDSGGPLVIQRKRDKRWVLAGVISWGIGCAEPNQPGVYTRISEFREWINQILLF